MCFLDRLLKLINETKITKNKLLTDLSLSKNSFVDWSNRGTVPNGDVLSKIADYLNISVDYLLGRTDYPYTIQADENGKPVIMPDGEPPICTDD